MLTKTDEYVNEIMNESFKSLAAAGMIGLGSLMPNTSEASPQTPTTQVQQNFGSHDMRGRRDLPRGIRNNNPGNIDQNGKNDWNGRDPWEGSVKGDDSRFVTFATTEMGIRALGKLLRTYQNIHGLNTIEGIITRWAPPKENDTPAYIALVSRLTGIGPKQKINVNEMDTLYLLSRAIMIKENGQRNLPPNSVILNGIERALR